MRSCCSILTLRLVCTNVIPHQAKMQEIVNMHAKISSKHDKVRQLLAQRNLQVASTTRKIDDVPTRMELIQYERR